MKRIATLLALLAIPLCINAQEPVPASTSKDELNARIEEYLAERYPSKVRNVKVRKEQVVVKGRCKGKGEFYLAEITPYEDLFAPKELNVLTRLEKKCFRTKLERKVALDGYNYDRVLSRWAIYRKVEGEYELVSHARYADRVASIRQLPEARLAGKKGLGGYRNNDYSDDLDKLAIHSVTVNVHLTSMIFTTVQKNDIPYEYGGVTFHFNGDEIDRYDKVMERCAEKGIVVSAILLVGIRSADPVLTEVFRHPENDGGYYSMPNMTNAQSVNAYAAVLSFLAERYTSGEHGRIHHWIMHNEVDAGTEWTNMGQQPMTVYLNEYVKSMRMCYNIVRQYDQHSTILGSYTHDWTATDNGWYASKDMLEETVAYSKAEGDFLWGVAYHPYPQDLNNPRLWECDTESTYSMDTKYCTFKNLEVLDKWIRDRKHFYRNRTKRILYLSENGTNSPSYEDADLEQQAAGACWAWKKVEALEGIDAIQWHAWIDNRGEFGLHIGLRRYPDDETQPGGEKPVWYVYEAAGTDREDKVFEPYLKTIGIESWDEIFHEVD